MASREPRRPLFLSVLIRAEQDPRADGDDGGRRDVVRRVADGMAKRSPQRQADERHPGFEDHEEQRESDPGSGPRHPGHCDRGGNGEGVKAKRENEREQLQHQPPPTWRAMPRWAANRSKTCTGSVTIPASLVCPDRLRSTMQTSLPAAAT